MPIRENSLSEPSRTACAKVETLCLVCCQHGGEARHPTRMRSAVMPQQAGSCRDCETLSGREYEETAARHRWRDLTERTSQGRTFWDHDRSDDPGVGDQRARRQVSGVEHIIWGSVPRARFDTFLGDWNRVLDRRAAMAIEAYAGVDDVCGLILAGSMGCGQQWPLSDIDFIPIYENDCVEEARVEAERLRLELIERWLPEGWWTGVDVGHLYFTRYELVQILPVDDIGMSALLAYDRWYHSLDKGYGGKAVFDPFGLTAQLVDTFNAYRFAQVTVSERLRRAHQEVEAARRELAIEIDRNHLFEATRTLRTAVK